jgi:hypothetical protein
VALHLLVPLVLVRIRISSMPLTMEVCRQHSPQLLRTTMQPTSSNTIIHTLNTSISSNTMARICMARHRIPLFMLKLLVNMVKLLLLLPDLTTHSLTLLQQRNMQPHTSSKQLITIQLIHNTQHSNNYMLLNLNNNNPSQPQCLPFSKSSYAPYKCFLKPRDKAVRKIKFQLQ